MSKGKNIVFFDGVCTFCNRWVDFLLARDSNHVLFFAPLSGTTAKEMLSPELCRESSSLVFFREGELFIRARAVIEICRLLSPPWNFLGLVGRIPFAVVVGDLIYRLIASNRYRLWGEREHCRTPNSEERAYFLD